MQTAMDELKNLNQNSGNRSSISAFGELSTTVVIVSNVSKNLTRKHLNEIFSAYGVLKGVYIPKDEESKLAKNYIYLEYLNKEDAEKASLYMGDGQIDGIKIKVEILTPPSEKIKNSDEADREASNKDREKYRDKDRERESYKYLHTQNNYNKSHTQIQSSSRRKRSRSRSRRRSISNKNKQLNYTNNHSRRNRSRSNNRKHLKGKESYSSSSSRRSSSSQSSNKSSSSN
jgi:RNA-binding protein with serine-rich domain 1